MNIPQYILALLGCRHLKRARQHPHGSKYYLQHLVMSLSVGEWPRVVWFNEELTRFVIFSLRAISLVFCVIEDFQFNSGCRA